MYRRLAGCKAEADAGVLPIMWLLLGPPGAGTSMLARRLTTILPAMTLAEAIETTRIHRVAGRTGGRTALVTTRPCRAPHHTISDAGLIGGGHVPTSGDVSLAHHGVLFLDELPECRPHGLAILRQPLEGCHTETISACR
jgi:magnesium chelatase family protein